MASRVLRIDPRRGFVEKEDGRIVDERARNHEALRHPATQLIHFRVRALFQEKEFEQFVGAQPGAPGTHAEIQTVVVQVLSNRQRPVERIRLRDDADDPLGHRRRRRDIDRADERTAARRTHARREHADRRCLAAPFGPSRPKISPRRIAISSESTARMPAGPP
jgi:hypothetical protein